MVNYPAQIDNSLSIPVSVDNNTPVTASVTNRLRDAIIAIESELGVKPGGVSTVKARFASFETTLNNLNIISLNGDLGGTINSPLVTGLQGHLVSNDEPSTNDVLSWNGLAWTPMPTGAEVQTRFTVGLTGSGAQWETDGVADEVQINLAIAACTVDGGIVLILPGTYYIAAPVNLLDNVTLQGSGADVTVIIVSTSFDYNTHKWAIGCSGDVTTGTAILLTSDASAGDQEIQATVGSELSLVQENDYLFLKSDGLWEEGSGNTNKLAEFIKVLDVTAGTISILGMTRSNYLTSDNASLYRMSFIENVSVLDLSVTQETAQGTATTTQPSIPPFVSLQRVNRGRVAGCHFYNGDCPAVTAYVSLDVIIENNIISDLTNDTPNKRLGYGVLVGGASARCTVDRNKFSRVRHAVDAGTSISAAGVTNSCGVARDVVVSNNICEHATNSCFTTHGGGDNWEFIGNIASNSLAYGFFMRARGSRIIGNTVSSCGGGIGIGDSSFSTSAGSAASCHVIGNSLRDIRTQTLTPAILASGVISSTYAGGEGIILALTDNVIVSNNTISECDGAGIRLRLSALRNQIINNTIIDANKANTANIPGILIDGNYNGASASIAWSAGITTLSGMTSQASQSIGRSITVSAAASAGNNGTFTILTVPSATSVTFANASGVDADANNGTIDYWIEGVTDNLISNNVVINRAPSRYDANSTGGYAKYAIRDAGTSGNIRNIYKNNTGIGMVTGLMSVNANSFSAGNSTTESAPVKVLTTVPADASFLEAPQVGTLTFDSSASSLYARTSSVDIWTKVGFSTVDQWTAGTTTVRLSQEDQTANSTNGQALTIRAQNALGTTSTGGSLFLSPGSGTTADGTIRLANPGGTTAITITANPTGASSISAASTVTGLTISQSSTSIAAGATLQLSAQATTGNSFNGGNIGLSAGSASGTTTTGGSINVSSGTGTSANGSINFRAGSTTFFTLLSPNPTGTVNAQAVSTVTALNLLQANTSAASGAPFTIQAQNSSFAGSTGGALTLKSGTGITANGNVVIQTGSTPRITISPTEITLGTTKTVESTATYGDFITELKEVSTTNDTVTDIYTWTITDEAVSVADVLVTAIKSDGSESDGWKGTIMFNRDGGTVTPTTQVVTQLGASAWTITLDNSTSTGRIRVTGAVATTIRWVATVRLQTTTTT